jgi:osmotically-inducible protein OsmY
MVASQNMQHVLRIALEVARSAQANTNLDPREGRILSGGSMKSDSDLKRAVEQELQWDPDIDATDIAVAVKDGIVTLTGFVRRYKHKRQAEAAAKRVAGVVGVANDIEVRLPIIHKKPDPRIARDAVEAIEKWLPQSSEHIRVVVNDGWVILEGEVEWNYQRQRAEDAVLAWVSGLRGITNSIQVKPVAEPEDVKREIEAAFQRGADIDASRITVEVDGSTVILKGTVRSWAEREEAERSAWRAPGITQVDDCLVLRQ